MGQGTSILPIPAIGTIRQVSGGMVTTVAGTNQQGFGGDGSPATSAILNSPKAAASDASGNLAIADKLNERLRIAALPTLTFVSGGVGIPGAQSVTLANTGPAAISVASIIFTGAFTTATGGSCSATPITLAPGANCTQNVAFFANRLVQPMVRSSSAAPGSSRRAFC